MKKFILFVFISIVASGNAQQVDDQFNSWWTYGGNHKITKKFGLHTFYSWRRNDFVKYWQQSLVRLGVNYSVTDNVVVTFGGDWLRIFPYGAQPIATTTNVFRTWEQLFLKQKEGRFYIKHRFRVEQNFIETFESTNDEYIHQDFLFANRFRYRLSVDVPLNKKEITDNTLFFSFFNETFLNFGKGTGNYIFNQNWMSFGLGWKVNKQLAFKLGYMNQYLVKPNDDVERNHTLLVTTVFNLR